MQVKKFDGETLQAALDKVKETLGPEAIILQTKKAKRGFGPLAKHVFEVTAAVSERSYTKKQTVERRLPESVKAQLGRFSASQQIEVQDKTLDDFASQAAQAKERVSLSKGTPRPSAPTAPVRAAPMMRASAATASAAPTRQASAQSPSASAPRVTERRYVDIGDEDSAPVSTVQRERAQLTERPSVGDSQLRVELEALRRELETLREAPGSHSSAQPLFSSHALQDAFELLTLAGVDRKIAHGLCKQTAFELGTARSEESDQVLDQLAAELLEQVQVMPLLKDSKTDGGPVVLAFVGPSGVGKTSVIVKLAKRRFQDHSKRVGIVSFNPIDVSQSQRLGSLSKMLQIPFRIATDREDLLACIAELQGMDAILIDTPSPSVKESAALALLEKELREVPKIHFQLVLSATTRDVELAEMGNRFSLFRSEGVVFTRLDEAGQFGSILNFSMKSKLPISLFSTGQKIPEDVEDATPERLVSLILGIY